MKKVQVTTVPGSKQIIFPEGTRHLIPQLREGLLKRGVSVFITDYTHTFKPEAHLLDTRECVYFNTGGVSRRHTHSTFTADEHLFADFLIGYKHL